MKSNIKAALLGICVVTITGCANANSIHRLNKLFAEGQTELIDAKQRAIISVPNGNPKNGDPLYRICAEPAPDVFSIYALAATADGSLETNPAAPGAAPGSTRAAGNIAFGSSENGSTIERTQTINLMRESMFRTCERYLSGAVDATTMKVQAARDQRAMVAILAIEQLTGVVKRKPTILTTEAQATLVTANKELIAQQIRESEDHDKKQAEVDQAKVLYDENKANYEASNKGNCETIINTPTSEGTSPDVAEVQEIETVETSTSPDGTIDKIEKNETNTTEPVPEVVAAAADSAELEVSKAECLGAKNAMISANATLSSKESARDAAKSTLEATRALLEKMSTTMLSASTIGDGNGDEGTNPYSKDRIDSVALAVSDITKAAFSDKSEIVFTCTDILNSEKGKYDEVTIKSCNQIILDYFRLEELEQVSRERNNAYRDIDRLESYIYKREQRDAQRERSIVAQNSTATLNVPSISQDKADLIKALRNKTKTCDVTASWVTSNKDMSQYFPSNKLSSDALNELFKREGWAAGDEIEKIYQTCK